MVMRMFLRYSPAMRTFVLLCIVFLMTACFKAPAPDATMDEHAGHSMPMEEEKPDLFVEDRSSGKEIAFSVLQGGKVITDFGVSHTKEMHLVVARDDLKYFYHLHPAMDEQGVWHVDFVPNASGRYWLYADFVDVENRPYTLRFSKDVPGAVTNHGFVRDERHQKSYQGTNVTFESVEVEGGTELRFALTDTEGNPVVLEEYLGAKGHSVLLSSVNGAYVHSHPSPVETTRGGATFFVPLERDPAYRIFTQFQIEGRVITTVFDW